jgi:hypothetical protein
LADASIASKMDFLVGLKENIILGQLIPAGTGTRRYYDMSVTSENGNIFGREFKEQIELDNIVQQEKLHRSMVEDIQAEMAEAIGHKDIKKIDEMQQGSVEDLFSQSE